MASCPNPFHVKPEVEPVVVKKAAARATGPQWSTLTIVVQGALILSGLVFGVMLVSTARGGGPMAHAAEQQLLFLPAKMMILPPALAFVIYRITKKRDSAFNATLTATGLGLLFLTWGGEITGSARASMSGNGFPSAAYAPAPVYVPKHDTAPVPIGPDLSMRDVDKSLGNDRAYRAAAAVAFKDLDDDTDTYWAHVEKLAESKETTLDAAALERQLASLTELSEKIQTLLHAHEAFNARVANELDRVGGAPVDNGFAARVRKGLVSFDDTHAQLEARVELITCESDILAKGIERIMLLSSGIGDHGTWRADTTGQIVFLDSTVGSQCRAIEQSIESLRKRQEAAHQRSVTKH